MTLQYSPKNNPRVIVIQKLYGKYFNDDEYSDNAGVFVWRKHARLQEFMARKWTEQNPSIKVEGHLAHLGFNGDQETPCYLTKEVVDELGEVEKRYEDWN